MWIWGFFTEIVPLGLLGLQCIWAMTEPWLPQPNVGNATISGPGGLLGTHGRRSAINQLVGKWAIHERHNMDEFLRALGFGSLQRALITKAGQDTEIIESNGGEAIKIVTTDLRGSTEIELPLGGKGVVAHDGDGGATVCRSATVERGDALIVTETLDGERQPLSVCKRTLSADGQKMIVDVTKRTPKGSTVAMQVVAKRVGGASGVDS